MRQNNGLGDTHHCALPATRGYRRDRHHENTPVSPNDPSTVSCCHSPACRRGCGSLRLLLLRLRKVLLAILERFGFKLLLQLQHGFRLSLVRHAERLFETGRNMGVVRHVLHVKNNTAAVPKKSVFHATLQAHGKL